MPGRFSLAAEATVDDKTAILSSSKLTAGPLGLAAAGPLRSHGRSARRHGDRPIRRAGPARADPRRRYLARPAVSRRTPYCGNLAKQPEGTVTLSGSADDLAVAALDGRLPGFGRTTLDATLGVQRDGSLTLDALNATTAVASVTGGGGSYLPRTEAGEVKATVELPSLAPFSALAQRPLVGPRPSRPVGAARWRRPDVRLAGHA